MSSTPPIVLSFAASDPTGGAGLQADLLTLASMGCHPLTVVTGITVQDTRGVDDMLPMEAEWVSDQARRLLEDMPVAAFKLGVLGSLENIEAIAEVLSDYPDIPVILDPVLASGRGDALANEAMIHAMCALLLPQTTLITPNSIEARRLAGAGDGQGEDDGEGDNDRDGAEGEAEDMPLADCAARLIELGCNHVLITGTHEQTADVVNTLYAEDGVVRRDSWKRLPGSYHGSGCTLASAIAAAMANGLDLAEAVREAQEYTWQALAAGFRPGMGQFIPDRFFWAREVERNPRPGES
jgi:hydroxymethylpyrimidine/phosphomethylpyrimidine kinase